ncbi:MAG: hypothetical protein JWO94_1725 [Verrucomicrobiaceae bacterium]|nr:hypothetical protein [Verrucomicrobiaceae bacterium]
MKHCVLLLAACTFSACSVSSPIEPYASSKSHFRHPPELKSHSYPDKDIYRVFEQGATGFVPVPALRAACMDRAQEFCEKQGRSLDVLGEQTKATFPTPGVWPAVELVFAAAPAASGGAGANAGAARLARLKILKDQGLVTQEEYEKEKERYLNSGR